MLLHKPEHLSWEEAAGIPEVQPSSGPSQSPTSALLTVVLIYH